MPGKPTTIDDYLARVGPEQRVALERLRKIIKTTAPSAEECISYQVPGVSPEWRARRLWRVAEVLRVLPDEWHDRRGVQG